MIGRLTFGALVIGSLIFVACGGDDGGTNNPNINFNTNNNSNGNGNENSNNNNTPTTCNPVTQQGCAGGEKCAPQVVSAPTEENPNAPVIVRTACVPEGNKGAGEACETMEPGENAGYDDCSAGYDCFLSVCSQICTSANGGNCAQENDAGTKYNCSVFGNLYEEFEDVGVCTPPCDLAEQDCPEGNGCYLGNLGVTLCLPPGDNAHGTACEKPDPSGPCFINGCAQGTDANAWTNVDISDFQGENFMLTVPDMCVQYCNPSGDFANNPSGDAGGVTCDLGGECRYLNGWLGYIDIDDPNWIPETVGLCIDSGWSTCDPGSDQYIHDLEAWLCAEDENDPNALKFVPGCSTGAEISAAIADADNICAAFAPTGQSKEVWAEGLIRRLGVVNPELARSIKAQYEAGTLF
jgi:hypothetical protein